MADDAPGDPARPALHRLTGRFADPDLEALYRAAHRARNLRQTRLTLVVIVALNSLFSAIDPLIFDNLTAVLWVHLAAVNGALLVLAGLSYAAYFRTRWPGLLAMAALVLIGLYAIMNYLGGASPAYYAGGMLVVVGIYVLLPFYFVHGTAVAWLASVLHLAGAAASPQIDSSALTLIVMQLATANLVGMFALYRTERFLRLDFVNIRAISEERSRYRELLVRILPRTVAERLQGGERTIADLFQDSTVLFADIVGFTAISARSPPGAVVEFLNRVFTAFDTLVERHGLEKIKTIGDSYMVAGGLSGDGEEGGGDGDHRAAMARLALDMRAAMTEIRGPDGAPVELRIGLHSGPLVAGVIGDSRFLYDLWGDTVNTASRMEALGAPGTIQVTAELRERLKDRFAFAPKGEVEVKGKGAMAIWELTGSAAAETADGGLPTG